MGITIHFKGQLDHTNDINSVIDHLKNISNVMNWSWFTLDEDGQKPMTSKLTHRKKGLQSQVIFL